MGMPVAGSFIAEDEIMQEVIWVFLFLQGAIEQRIRFIRADVFDKFADGFFANRQCIVAHDEISGLVNCHTSPPIPKDERPIDRNEFQNYTPSQNVQPRFSASIMA